MRGKFCYFGKVESDPKGAAALELWLSQKDELLAGRIPRSKSVGLTLHELCNGFCEAKERQVDSGDIGRRMFTDYHAVCKILIDCFGKQRAVDDIRPEDFEKLRAKLAKRYSAIALGNRVQRIRSVFKYGYEAGLLEKPALFGPAFKRPAKRIMRLERQEKGPRMFEARHIRRLLKAAPQPLRAMILLGINCGFGNHDCGSLPLSAVDLMSGWINYPRPKTAIERRCPLWPETVAALQEAVAQRTKPTDTANDGLVFVTKYGGPWAKDTSDNPVTKEMRKLLNRLGFHRPGLGFYALRHTFETIAGECKDQVAVDAIMGHADASMAAHYRERISDERLLSASNQVKEWLFRKAITN
ncbi:tyrosine-type recombinase/integrase [Lacipirellula sp.]|uniref:tyrosine-type recombinase/integrase n=1 Tax=Lacipirellula sp. TaxID=2691419 RepID=UPI003D099ABA